MAGVTDVSTYCGILAEQLRINGVRERKVREIVAQVAQHCLMTGQDPIDAFGTPVDCARSWHPLRWVSWLLRLGAACVGIMGLLAIFTSLDPVDDIGWTEDLPITASEIRMVSTWVFAGAVIPWTVGIWVSRLRARLLGHPNHRRVMRSIDAAVFGVVVILVGLAFWRGDQATALPDLSFSQPRWLVLLFGVLSIPGLYFWGFRSQALPGAPRQAWQTKVRRFFT